MLILFGFIWLNVNLCWHSPKYVLIYIEFNLNTRGFTLNLLEFYLNSMRIYFKHKWNQMQLILNLNSLPFRTRIYSNHKFNSFIIREIVFVFKYCARLYYNSISGFVKTSFFLNLHSSCFWIYSDLNFWGMRDMIQNNWSCS